MKYYLIGIKGSAMASLAKLLLDLGHEVSGVDFIEDYYTLDSQKLGIKVETFENVTLSDDYYYIIGNAFANHPLTKFIINVYDNYEYYPKFIDKLFNLPKVAVSGAHGKTTTTKMIAKLSDGKSNYIIGDGSGGSYQDASFFVFEACEYKGTFLNYHPQILVITNIDYDHPDYYDSLEDVFNSFQQISKQSELVIYNGDDSLCRRLDIYNKVSYGLSKDNDLSCEYNIIENGYHLFLKYNDHYAEFILPFLGTHMIYDFLAAYAVLHLQGISDEDIRYRLEHFELPKRRLQTYNYADNIIICDYAHHPTEIKALYETLKLKYINKKLIIIFEPHTNTRSLKFKKEFKEVLHLFTEAYLADIFTSVREKDDLNSMNYFFEYIELPKYTLDTMRKLLQEKASVICFVGAGNVDHKFEEFIALLKDKNTENC